MADSSYIIAMLTEYGTQGLWLKSRDDKKTIERNLQYCIDSEEPFSLIDDNGECQGRYNGITGYSVIEITPKMKVR